MNQVKSKNTASQELFFINQHKSSFYLRAVVTDDRPQKGRTPDLNSRQSISDLTAPCSEQAHRTSSRGGTRLDPKLLENMLNVLFNR